MEDTTFIFKARKNLDLHPLSQSFFLDLQEEQSSVAFSPCVRQQEQKPSDPWI
jgi:hypothetical protein